MTEPESADGLVEQAFAAAGDALDVAIRRLRELRELGGLQGPPLRYLMHSARRLDESLHGLAIARTCAKVMQAGGQQDAAGEQLVLIQ